MESTFPQRFRCFRSEQPDKSRDWLAPLILSDAENRIRYLVRLRQSLGRLAAETSWLAQENWLARIRNVRDHQATRTVLEQSVEARFLLVVAARYNRHPRHGGVQSSRRLHADPKPGVRHPPNRVIVEMSGHGRRHPER